MKTLITRTLTATVFVAILLGCTYYNQLTFSALFFLITVVGLWEFYSLSEKANNKSQKILDTTIGSLIFIINAFVCMGYFPALFLLLIIPLFFIVFIIELFTHTTNPFQNIAFSFLGLIYVAIPFSLLNYIATISGEYSYQLMFGIYFILWSNDSGAYLAGSAFGKHKLFPRVSPGKTWEGSVGGAIISLIIAYVISGWYTSINLTDWIIIACILIIIGTLGDLVESLFKRSVNVKDSGSLLPGHGGVLDRFDSLIMATPFIFTYLLLKQFL